jgi:aminopeptidase
LAKKEDFKVSIEPFGDAKAAAEGAVLTSYSFDTNKSTSSQLGSVETSVFFPGAKIDVVDAWRYGAILAQAQNTARYLQDLPGNQLTPTMFAKYSKALLHGFKSTEMNVYDREWAESKGMGSFLSVARGSEEPLKFVEIIYRGGAKDAKPLALVGKGVTFDTGGISLKPSADMASMKGDMGGAAVVLSAMWAIAKLQLPINVVAAIPLTENMPSGIATKPGDVVNAMNGKTIEVRALITSCTMTRLIDTITCIRLEVDNTDAEGRLILADAIYYASTEHKPHTLIELSTLTGAMDVALGYPYAGVFASADSLWTELEAASKTTGEGLWRMPLDDAYKPQIASAVADLKNVGVSFKNSLKLSM